MKGLLGLCALLVLSAPATAAEPCLSAGSCPEGAECVAGRCLGALAWLQAPPVRVVLALGTGQRTCRQGMAAAARLRAELMSALAQAGVEQVEAGTRSRDPLATPGSLELLGRALGAGARALITVSPRCPKKGRAGASVELLDLLDLLPVRSLARTDEALRTVTARWRWANAVRALDGGPAGRLTSRVAFSCKMGRGVREIFSLNALGADLRQETHFHSLTMLPSWAPDGRVGATSYVHGNPDVFLGARPLFRRPGLNTGVDFAARGGAFVVAAEAGDAQDIFLGHIGHRGLVQLTYHPGIDTSPALDPAARRVLFVSDRAGSPQVYLLDLRSRRLRRITTRGDYNSSPAWGPRGRVLAWSRRRSGSRYDILVGELNDPEGTARRFTVARASLEDPSFSPDGRLLVAAEIDQQGARPVILELRDGSVRPLSQVELLPMCSQPAWSLRLP